MLQHAAGKAQRRDLPNTSLSGWTQGHLGLVAVAGQLQRTSGSFVPWSIPLKVDLLIPGKFDPVFWQAQTARPKIIGSRPYESPKRTVNPKLE
jgi:hypothetical protein